MVPPKLEGALCMVKSKVYRELAMLALIVAVVFAFSEGIKVAAGTSTPISVVDGRSMEPTFYDGDIVLVVGVKPSELKVGDVIVYRASNGLIIHRIIGVAVEGGRLFFTTKGDNNPVPDPMPVPEDRVVGRVVGVILPRAGGLLDALIPYKYAIIGVLLALLVAVALWPSKKGRNDGEGGEGQAGPEG
ncbi:MAG: signal peptidase I [Candidatus Nezhaarchaeota archaeon]|nr:signal peptidase I [Candidatus Nezhaarchaeota archaeon]